jgi:hypothetical protein
MKAPQAHVAGGENTKALPRNAADAAAPQTSSRARRRPATAQEGLELRTAILDHEDALAVLRDRIFALRCAVKGASLANEDDRRGLIQISEDISDAIGQAITALEVTITRKMRTTTGPLTG